MQIDNHNYEVYTNNDLIAIHKPRSTVRAIIITFRLLTMEPITRREIDNNPLVALPGNDASFSIYFFSDKFPLEQSTV